MQPERNWVWRVREARDGAAIRDEAVLRVTAVEDAEVLLVDAA